jgi:hypothetical protein
LAGRELGALADPPLATSDLVGKHPEAARR